MTHQRQHAIHQHGHHRRAGRALALDAWRADKTRSRSTNPLPVTCDVRQRIFYWWKIMS